MPENFENPLQGWKEIASHLERDERTARRWEKEENLPIRRHRAEKRSSVYAYPSEIEQWRTARTAAVVSPSPAADQGWVWAAVAATCLTLVGFVFFLQRSGMDPIAEAGAVSAPGIRTTELCRRCDSTGDISPDGKYFSETDWVTSGEIAIRNLSTGELHRLGPKASWDEAVGQAEFSVFSPDGKQIAYNWFYGKSEIRIIDAAGESLTPNIIYTTPDKSYIRPAGWTRDGRLLVDHARSDWTNSLGFLDIASGQITLLKSIAKRERWEPMLSPDDRWIAYAVTGNDGEGRDIYLLAADGSAELRVTRHKADDFPMGFAPDSRMLLFASDRTGTVGLWGAPLAVDGTIGNPQILMKDIGKVFPVGVDDGGALVYERQLGSVDLYKAELDFETGRLLSHPSILPTDDQGDSQGPWLSPDGGRFAYLPKPPSGRNDRRTIGIRDLDTGREREIVLDEFEIVAYLDPMVWSPDGRKLLTQAKDRQGRWTLAAVDVETENVDSLVVSDRQVQPVGWTMDGREVLYHFTRGGGPGEPAVRTIAALTLGQSEPRILYETKNGLSRPIAVSPQRDQLAWSENVGTWDEAARIIKVMTIVDGQVRTLAHRDLEPGYRPRSIAWTPDQSALLVTSDIRAESPNAGVWILPLDSSAARKTQLDADKLPRMRHAAIHPDGKTIFFQAGKGDFRLFKTENYLPTNAESTE